MTDQTPFVSCAWDFRGPRWRIVVDGRMSPLAFKELETVQLTAGFLRHMGHDVQVLPTDGSSTGHATGTPLPPHETNRA